MNFVKYIILICITVCTQVSYTNTLDTFLTVNRFFDIDKISNYIELSFLVPPNNVSFKSVDDVSYQAKLKVNCKIYKQTSLINKANYILQSKLYKSPNDIIENMTDVIRLKVPENDTFTLVLNIVDFYNENVFYNDTINIYIPKRETSFMSDIMLVNKVVKQEIQSPFSRNNIIVIPKFINFYPKEIDELQFYCEMYSKQEGNFLMSYLITNERGIHIDGYAAHKRIKNKNFDVLISGFNLSTLPSGNYYIFVELKNDKNEIIERKRAFFQRSNDNANVVENINEQKNELDVITNNFARKYDLRNIIHHTLALKPIAKYFEKATIESIENSKDLEQIQNFFYSFWHNKNSINPEAEWMAYAKKVKYVEQQYTNISQRGFETDRGIVYLKYGKPFYKQLKKDRLFGEIWVWNYEFINGESNIYFIFQNNENITDEFRLVHSNLKGHLSTKYWSEYLKSEL